VRAALAATILASSLFCSTALAGGITLSGQAVTPTDTQPAAGDAKGSGAGGTTGLWDGPSSGGPPASGSAPSNSSSPAASTAPSSSPAVAPSSGDSTTVFATPAPTGGSVLVTAQAQTQAADSPSAAPQLVLPVLTSPRQPAFANAKPVAKTKVTVRKVARHAAKRPALKRRVVATAKRSR